MFNFSPCGSPGSTVTAYPRPVPARGCVACSVCPVAVLSEHAHPVMHILHITFVFCSPPRVLQDCVPHAVSARQLPVHPARRFTSSHVSSSHPPPGFAVHMLLLSLPWPCRAVTVLLSLPPSLFRLQACVTTPPSP